MTKDCYGSTSAQGLLCKKIIFISSRTDIAAEDSIKHAERLKMQSIAFPTLGNGNCYQF